MVEMAPFVKSPSRIRAEFFAGLEQEQPIVEGIHGVCAKGNSGYLSPIPGTITQTEMLNSRLSVVNDENVWGDTGGTQGLSQPLDSACMDEDCEFRHLG